MRPATAVVDLAARINRALAYLQEQNPGDRTCTYCDYGACRMNTVSQNLVRLLKGRGPRPRCAARKGPDDTSPRCLRVAKHGGERHVYEQREMRDWYENELDPA